MSIKKERSRLETILKLGTVRILQTEKVYQVGGAHPS